MIAVNKAGEESIEDIQQLAHTTWKAAYSSILSPEQMTYMLDLFYSVPALQKQMQEGHQFIVAKEKNVVVGFASYSQKSAEQPAVYRLHKIYIDPQHQGKGIGKLMIGNVINDISYFDATDLELNVNRSNKALQFYETLGFKKIKEEDVDIGNGYFMNDFVLNLTF